MRAILLTFVALFIASCTTTPPPVSEVTSIEDRLYTPQLEGIRWGVIVTDLSGKVIAEHRADERFLPASNVKLLTSAAAFRWKDALDAVSPGLATSVQLEPQPTGPPALVLTGRGDPTLSGAPDCETGCLSGLVDAVKATGMTTFQRVDSDTSWFPDEQWPSGWSWDDLIWSYGAAPGALVLNDGVERMIIRPGPVVGAPLDVSYPDRPDANWRPEVSAITTNDPDASLRVSLSSTGQLVISGGMTLGAPPRRLRLGSDTPETLAASALASGLTEAGITLTQPPSVRIGDALPPPKPAGEETEAPQPPLSCTPIPTPLPANTIAQLPPPDWAAVLTRINKASQNLYAEAVLRQLGRLCSNGSTDSGLAYLNALMAEAGAAETGYDLFDGSGLSVYNRLSPRAIHSLLLHATTQDWGARWRDTFPVGGLDGTLRRRFSGTGLEGRIFAKTGTLKGTNALSGYLQAASGQTLVFSIIANDRPLGETSAIPVMDALLVEIAAQN